MENNLQKKYFYGFDYLRIILCILVVALHANVFSLPSQYIATSENPLYYRILLYNVFWACVPTFFIMSLYLYIRKSINDKAYARKRIKKLAIIYVFWACVDLVLTRYGNISFIFYLKTEDLILTLMSKNTIVYFLFNLLYLTIITEIIIRIYKKFECKKLYIMLSIIGFITMTFSIYFAKHIFFSEYFAYNLEYSNPLLYISYPFFALFLYKIEDLNKNKIKLISLVLLVLSIIFSIIDWKLRANNWNLLKYNFQDYGRISLVFESTFITLFFSRIKKTSPKFIRVLSNLTMGVFLIHTFVLSYVAITFANSPYPINTNGLALTLITLFLSFIITYVIKYVKGLV